MFDVLYLGSALGQPLEATLPTDIPHPRRTSGMLVLHRYSSPMQIQNADQTGTVAARIQDNVSGPESTKITVRLSLIALLARGRRRRLCVVFKLPGELRAVDTPGRGVLGSH